MEAIARENDLYNASIESFAQMRFAGEPEWLASLRREAFARFTAMGFPTTKDEEWKYTGVGPITRVPFRPANERRRLQQAPHPGLLTPGEGEETLPGGEGGRFVFVNGRSSAELSRAGSRPVVRSLREALQEEPELLEPHLARHASFEKSAFTALNTAFLEDGAFVRIPRGTILEEPIHLIFFSEDGGGPAVSHPRNLILAEPNSQARIIETYVGEAGHYFTNSVTEIVCGDGAVLEHYKLQRESLAGFHVQTVGAAQERGSNFASHNVCLGAALARTDINVLFEAEGSECTLNGLFLAGGSQHVDNHTLIDHAVPHTTSRELYKGILAGRSKGVFHGRIVVRPDAQKTDARQASKNLLLSPGAEIDTKPQLEIHADDVRCTHGSTIGQLDADALFYLRSRGLDEARARGLLTRAFAAEVAEAMRFAPLRERVQDQLLELLEAA